MKSSIRLKLLGSFLTVVALMAALGVVALERLGAAEAAARADGGSSAAVHDAIASGRIPGGDRAPPSCARRSATDRASRGWCSGWTR